MTRRTKADTAPPLDLIIDVMRHTPEDGEPVAALFGRNPRTFNQLAIWETKGALGRQQGVRVVRVKRLPDLMKSLDAMGFMYEVNE